ncbi:MAG TPA: glutamine amidotransferase, partial [Pirellulales bacterium]
ESQFGPDYTDIAAAIKLAQAAFPHDAAKRIVLISDGNQNIGDALEEARAASEAGISIDVLPIRYGARSEIIVEKVTVPPDIRKGQPFDLRIVVNNTNPEKLGEAGHVRGKLIVSQRTNDQPRELSREDVDLPPGKSRFTVRQQIDDPDFYTYEAQFIPDNPAMDAMSQNNRATAFTHVRGSGQVLLIESYDNRGEHQQLVDRLRAKNLEVTVRPSNQLFTSLPELQQFDTVILANVPRSGGEDAAKITHFSDEQIKMLVTNTEFMGSGLVMLGGPNSFGAGGWTNTDLEKAMPVDFQIKSTQVVPKGALALIMHASEMADGNHWQKVIAKEAVKALGPEDYCGVMHWDGTDKWLWGGITVVRDRRNQMLGLLDRMIPGDMPQFDPGLRLADNGFRSLKDAAVKHMIVISDGDPAPPSQAVINSLKQGKVTVTTVAVGCHGTVGHPELERLALQTGGKYYVVQSPNALPKIFQREARRIAQPLVYENVNGFTPRIKYPHEITSGITTLPPLTGFVRTTIKQNPLVETAIVSPVPSDENNATILATWTYGLGRAVAFTTDDGARWAKQWATWSDYDKFFSQLVRWSMRPVNDQGKFTVATEVEGGKVKVFVTALDKDDDFLNFLDLSGSVIGPNVEPSTLKLEQTAPGRYVGEFDAQDAGSYFMMISPGAGQSPLRTGVNVPYSAEFSDREADLVLLEALADLTPKGGKPGVLMNEQLTDAGIEMLLAEKQNDPFRRDLPPANSSQDTWHWLVLAAACLFFFDVFFRRVTVNFAFVPVLAGRLRDRILRRQAAPAATEYMDRLRSKKAEVSERLEQQRTAARFEAPPDAKADASVLNEPPPSVSPQKPAASQPPPAAKPGEEESYTSRLLKAKKKVWEDRDKEEK